MRYFELFESENIPTFFWINAKTGEIIPAPYEHATYVVDDPKRFGLDPDEVQEIVDEHGDEWSSEIMELVTEQGWVRGGRVHFQNDSIFLQGYLNEHLHTVANILADKMYFKTLLLDTVLSTHRSQEFKELEGKALEHWLTTGRFLPNNRMYESEEELQSVKMIEKLKPELTKAAQRKYDRWQQDESGYDEEVGYGGICQDIAEEMANILNQHGIDSTTVDSQGVGDQHVWVVSKTQEGIYSVDIPPYVYETGGGFNWTKKPDIEIDPSDIVIYGISNDPDDWEDYVGDY